MGAYFNRFYCMMAAIVTSYFVNMMYNINSALAAFTCPDGTACQTVSNSWNCAIVNGSFRGTMYPYSGGSYSTELGNGGGSCNYISAASVLKGMVPSGYTLAGCHSDGAGGVAHSGRAECSYKSCYAAPVSPTTKTVNCGVVTMCGTSTATASCSQSGRVGFLTNGGKGCACCPTPTGAADYRPHGSSTVNVYAIYNAAAISSCYLVGNFEDETGVFQFTDDNRCYYAS